MGKLYTVIFSPTGTSSRVAEYLARALGGGRTLVDLCRAQEEEFYIERGSVCIFAVPCYGGRVPQTAVQRLSRVHGAGALAVVCVTFGNRAFEDSLLELADLVEKNGFSVAAACAVAAEHNIMHIFGQGRPDAQDEAELRQFAAGLAQKLESGMAKRPAIPGKRPYKERHGSTAPVLVDGENCVSCGLCAARCPVKAISPDGRLVDGEVCINCMRCIQLCPQKCRSLPEDFVAGLIQRLEPACQGRKANGFYL